MNRRPQLLTFMSASFFLIAFSVLLQPLILMDYKIWQFFYSLRHLNILHWSIIVLCLASSVASWNAHASLRWTLPLSAAAVTLNNLALYKMGSDHSYWPLIGAALFSSTILLLFAPSTKALLEKQRLRWWKRSPRKSVRVPVFINPMTGRSFHTQTFDISESGFFFTFEETVFEDGAIYDFDTCGKQSSQNDSQAKNHAQDLEPGHRLSIKMTLGKLRTIRVDAKVVRKTESKMGIYPSGLGLMFDGIPPRERQFLRRFLADKKNVTVQI